VLQSSVFSTSPSPSCSLRNHSAWYNDDCRAVKVVTRRLERTYRNTRSSADREAWRRQSSYQRFFFNEQYVGYWTRVFKNNLGDSKALWSKVSALLMVSSTASSSSVHSAEDFATFFRNKVDTIRTATATAPPTVITSRPFNPLSLFREVTTAEVTQVVGRAPAKHCQLDPAPTWLVKRLMPLLADTIATLCNKSMSEGVFPDGLMFAVVRPRLKKPSLNTDELSSYRPISNLCFISKIAERVVATRFIAHAEEQQLLPCRQSAYRAHHSTETAMVVVHDELVRALDSGRVCALVLLDLSAAFDTIDHDILLQVLRRRFGVEGGALDWFVSYLSNRSQSFQLGAKFSGPHPVDCSVPQGSVLGPQEFIAYTDDLTCLIDRYGISHHLYADDTQLIDSCRFKDISVSTERLQQCIETIHGWCASRRLQLNPSKTEVIWFGTAASVKKISGIDAPSYRTRT
jgi:hypothetical protein